MFTNDSTTNGRPAKPTPGFPLYPHRSGRWAKKICGKTRFFGPCRDPQGALARYLAEKDDLETAGLGAAVRTRTNEGNRGTPPSESS
jgi:hypothetical protein